MRMTIASARRDILELTVDNLSVKMDVRMVDVVSDLTAVPAFMDSLAHSVKEITGQVRVSLRSTTRCARGSSQASCVQRLCAAPPLGGPGVTPARCAQPSLSPADGASSPTYALELAKMLMNARLFLGYAREETVSIQWALLNANVLLVTSRAKLLRNVKTLTSAASFLGYVKLANVPTPWEAIFVFVHVDM